MCVKEKLPRLETTSFIQTLIIHHDTNQYQLQSHDVQICKVLLDTTWWNFLTLVLTQVNYNRVKCKVCSDLEWLIPEYRWIKAEASLTDFHTVESRFVPTTAPRRKITGDLE